MWVSCNCLVFQNPFRIKMSREDYLHCACGLTVFSPGVVVERHVFKLKDQLLTIASDDTKSSESTVIAPFRLSSPSSKASSASVRNNGASKDEK